MAGAVLGLVLLVDDRDHGPGGISGRKAAMDGGGLGVIGLDRQHGFLFGALQIIFGIGQSTSPVIC